MGAGASVPGAEAAKDDVFSPLTPGVSAPVAARARAASIVVKSAGDQVGQLLARIQAAPSDTAVLSKAMYKGDYRPPVTHSGELMSMNSRGKWKTLYYELSGCHMACYKNKEDAAAGKTPKSITSFSYVIDQQSILDSANLKSLDAGFVGEREASAPQMFYVYTRKKTVSYKTTTTAEKNGWLNAMNDAMNEAFSESELESKKLSEVELRPVMLEQAALQFARCKQIVANLQTSGFLPVEKVHTLKKGYLKFQRAQYEEQEFYASLSPDYKVTTKQFKKYYCALMEDRTLVYAKKQSDLRENPKGVVSLRHVAVKLHVDEMEKTGKMVFSLATPLRSFTLLAPHQVALEEWLATMVHLAQGSSRDEIKAALTSLKKMDIAEVDLPGVLDDELGMSVYEEWFVNAEGIEVQAKLAFDCLKLIVNYNELDDGEPEEGELAELGGAIKDKYLTAGAADELVEQVKPKNKTEAAAQLAALADGGAADLNSLKHDLLKHLHRSTFKAFRASSNFAEIESAATSKKVTAAPIAGKKFLVWEVPDSEKKAKAGKAKRTKRKGDVYWGKLKRGENMIGRSGECQIIIDDSKASRQHARIDIDADDNVVFLDLGSSRGAKVNGKTVSGRTPMSVGDQIKIGSTVMTLTVNDGLDEGELKE